jgi:hypothetical protein
MTFPHDGFDALPDFFGFHIAPPLAASIIAKKEKIYTLDGRHVKEKTAPRLGRTGMGRGLLDRLERSP